MKNDLNKDMGEIFWYSNGLKSLTVHYSGRIFPEVRDEVGVVLSLEFPDCKGTHLGQGLSSH